MCRWWTCTRSAPAAARSHSSTRPACCRSVPKAPAPSPAPSATAAAARELAIPKILIPAKPGLTNALGCLVADVRHDYVRTVNKPVAVLDVTEVRKILEAQIGEGKATIAREGVDIEELVVIHSADMQYLGQSHILTLALKSPRVTRQQLHDD